MPIRGPYLETNNALWARIADNLLLMEPTTGTLTSRAAHHSYRILSPAEAELLEMDDPFVGVYDRLTTWVQERIVRVVLLTKGLNVEAAAALADAYVAASQAP